MIFKKWQRNWKSYNKTRETSISVTVVESVSLLSMMILALSNLSWHIKQFLYDGAGIYHKFNIIEVVKLLTAIVKTLRETAILEYVKL